MGGVQQKNPSGNIQPLSGVRVVELGGPFAASMAVKDGLPKCKPVLLEPVMKMDVTTPEEFLGDVLGNLNSKRAQIQGVDANGTLQTIHCHIPLAETFGYTTDLRSLTQGRASSSMEFYRYEEVPNSIADKVEKKAVSL